MKRSVLALVALTTVLAGCDRLNFWGRFSNSQPETLTPKGGYPTQSSDSRQLIPHIANAQLSPTSDGALLTVTGQTNGRGWYDVALTTQSQGVDGQISAPDGVLRLRMVGHPSDQPMISPITAALPLSRQDLVHIRMIEVQAADRIIRLRP